MNSFRQQFFAFTGISGIYLGVLALAFSQWFSKYSILSIALVWAIFVLSSLITSLKPPKDPQVNVQRFLIATTVQMLSAMTFILVARFQLSDHFRGMSIHFMALFFCFLAIQAYLLVKRVKTT